MTAVADPEVLSKRKHPLAHCESCPLQGPENSFCPSYGPDKADIVVIGEAPGAQEARQGIPFIGPSGKLLTTVLTHHGINRREVFLTNTCLCRPPENATPPKEAMVACRSRLMEEVNSREPKYVLPLGGPAAQTILSSTRGITALRVGPGKETSNVPGAVVIPSWHPAYCLRKPDAFPHLVSDVGKIKTHGKLNWTWPDYQVAAEPEQALHVIKQLLEGPYEYLAVDIEYGFDKDEDFEHPNHFDLLCIGIGYAQDGIVILGYEACHDPEVIEQLKILFSPKTGKKFIYQNGKSDCAGFWPVFGYIPEVSFDTMFASYALDERPGNHGLEYQAVEYLGTPPWKQEIKKYVPKGGSYANIPRPILYAYNAKDIAATWGLYELWLPRLLKSKTRFPLPGVVDEMGNQVYQIRTLLEVHDFMVAAGNALVYLELNGIAFDLQESNVLSAAYLERLEVLETKINDVVSTARERSTDPQGQEAEAPAWFNPRSPMQVAKFLQERGANVRDTTADTLERLQGRARPGSPLSEFLTAMLKHRYEAKRYGTYVKGMQKRRYLGRIFTTYTVPGTTSGRLASKNPNLQNVVRDVPIRRQFSVSKAGNIFIQCDYGQAEGRIICWLAQDEYLRHIFLDPNRKLFHELSNELYGEGKWEKEEYIRTKAFFYGISYGREPHSIALEFGMSTADATRRYEAFMDLIPATAAWQRSIKAQVLSGQNLVTPFGRQRRFFLITDENRKDVLNEALSFLPQSTASDVCLSALIRLRPMLRGKAFIRLTIHDAIVAECAEERKEEVSALMAQVMIEEAAKLQDYVPFRVDTSFGRTWGDL